MSVKSIVIEPFAERKGNNISVNPENASDASNLLKVFKIHTQDFTLVFDSDPVLFDIQLIPFLVHGNAVGNVFTRQRFKAPIIVFLKI